MGRELNKVSRSIMNRLITIGLASSDDAMSAEEIAEHVIKDEETNRSIYYQQIQKYIRYVNTGWLSENKIKNGNGYYTKLNADQEKELLETLLILNMNYDRFLDGINELVYKRRGEDEDGALNIVSKLISAKVNEEKIKIQLKDDPSEIVIEPTRIDLNEGQWIVHGFVEGIIKKYEIRNVVKCKFILD